MGRIATNVAEASGATATLELIPAPNPPLINDPALTDWARRVVEAEFVRVCLEGRSACELGIRVQSQREERHALP